MRIVQRDCIVFKKTDSINELLDHVLQFSGEVKRVNCKIVKYKQYILAHNVSAFDSYVGLNNLLQWRIVVSLIKNGSSILSVKTFNSYVGQTKKVPQYVKFRCGIVLIDNFLKRVGKSYILQQFVIKQEMDHNEVYEETWENKKKKWLPYLKDDMLSTVFSNAKSSKGMQEKTEFGMKNSIT